ncbi:MAG TPA: LysR family transcriptional regulator [Acidisoma sp.]|nr:LysR family transcriptional regulator [Acidisoma sp.]
MRQIAYLIALDRHGHFGRAAKSCHVSQPALSAAISKMQREQSELPGHYAGKRARHSPGKSLTTSELLRRLQKRDIDCAITYPSIEDLRIFDKMMLYAERYVLLAHRDTALPPTLSWRRQRCRRVSASAKALSRR